MWRQHHIAFTHIIITPTKIASSSALAWSANHHMSLLYCCAFTGAEAGTLTFMVGGNKAAAEAATPILQHMSSHVTTPPPPPPLPLSQHQQFRSLHS
jgi:hypothetical protein